MTAKVQNLGHHATAGIDVKPAALLWRYSFRAWVILVASLSLNGLNAL
jgi:hypothetical protein